MDIHMPIMNGSKTIETLKATFNAIPPIVALTAEEWGEDKSDLISQGFMEVYHKPFSLKMCDDMIAKCFS